MKKSINKDKKKFLRLICLTENEKRIMQKYKCTNLAINKLFLKRVNG
jgi:hypothetical protein|tara:strand:+ start:473 stop:613 length:141 start_codon:yes stop_codon:yes gene_type:complete